MSGEKQAQTSLGPPGYAVAPKMTVSAVNGGGQAFPPIEQFCQVYGHITYDEVTPCGVTWTVLCGCMGLVCLWSDTKTVCRRCGNAIAPEVSHGVDGQEGYGQSRNGVTF